MGRRPTLHNDCVPSVETHLFDFAGDLYGQPLLLELHCRLRAIQRFDDLTQLLEQIRQDCAQARAFWGLGGPQPVLYMDAARHRAALNGQELRLSPRNSRCCACSATRPAPVLTKEDIYLAVWREPSNGCLHAVENTVFQLRRKLRPLGGAGLIETVAGYGYKLAAGVCVEAD